MIDDLNITPQMTKKAVIDQYNKLLETYETKLHESKEVEKKKTEADKRLERQALNLDSDASVETVVKSVENLKSLIARTLNQLLEEMTAQAERLEMLKKSIELRELRLQELYNIESAADAFDKLIAAYKERKEAEEVEFGKKSKELELAYSEKMYTLEAEYKTRSEKLEKQSEEMRAKWKEEEAKSKSQYAESQDRLKREREKEEAEYFYERDRRRKIEEDAYTEKKTAMEKAVLDAKVETERKLKDREAAIVAQEKEFADLKQQVGAFPEKLLKEIEKARKTAIEEVKKEETHAAQLKELEFKWEKKVLEQKVTHFEGTIAAQTKKIEEFSADFKLAQKQVQDMANKVIEGASESKAFHSVKQIALEQAKKIEKME